MKSNFYASEIFRFKDLIVNTVIRCSVYRNISINKACLLLKVPKKTFYRYKKELNK